MDPTYQGYTPQVPYNSPKRGFHLTPKTLIIGGLILVAIIAGIVMLNLGGDKSGPLQQRLSARMTTMQKLVAEGTKHIKDPDLREFNSRLSIQITSDLTTIDDIMKTNGMKGVSKEVAANEADQASFDSLSDAALNSNFDPTYRRIIEGKLDTTTALMKELYGATPSKSLKTAVDESYGSLKKLESQLDDL